jgi:serine/threonine protein kinase
MSLTPGSQLGSYEIQGLLGEGGMGQVYKARDGKLGREVAIKVLPASVANDPERLARFEREAKLLASLSHTNIAQIYGLEDAASSGQGGRFLVMELAPGQDLSVILAARGRSAPASVASSESASRRRDRERGWGPREQLILRKPFPSRCNSPTHSKPPTNAASSIAI